MIEKMQQTEGVTKKLKPYGPMVRVGRMNRIVKRAEAIVMQGMACR
mgnify:CR=1 FL=1